MVVIFDGAFEPRTLRQPFLNAVHMLSTGCDVDNLEINVYHDDFKGSTNRAVQHVPERRIRNVL